MQGLNSVTIGGNLVRDPEVRATAGGSVVMSFGVAVNESRKNQQTGEWEGYTNFIDCVMFGKRAESVSRFIGKGSYVAVTGKLHQSRWEKDGAKRSKIEVVVDNIHFEGRRDEQGYAQSQVSDVADVYDEDIPF